MTVTVKELDFKPHPSGIGGKRAIVVFENGYSASVLFGGPFYTENGTYEVAVMCNGSVCYSTPVTSDVLGYLSEEEADKALKDISMLPSEIN